MTLQDRYDFLPLLPRRSPRFREVTWLAQSRSSTNRLGWDLVPSPAVTQVYAPLCCSEITLPSVGSLLMALCLGLCIVKVGTKNLIGLPQGEKKGGNLLFLCETDHWELGGSRCEK